MTLFKFDTGKKLERELDAARSTRDKLTERLQLAESAVAESRAAAQRLAREGAADGALGNAEAALRAHQGRVVTLAAAVVDLNQQVATLQSESDDLADKKLRSETALAIEKLADEITKAGATFDAGAGVLSEVTGRAAAIILDAKGLEIFTASVRSEVPAAVTMIAGILRDRARATTAGTAPASLPLATPATALVQLPDRVSREVAL